MDRQPWAWEQPNFILWFLGWFTIIALKKKETVNFLNIGNKLGTGSQLGSDLGYAGSWSQAYTVYYIEQVMEPTVGREF